MCDELIAQKKTLKTAHPALMKASLLTLFLILSQFDN